MGTRALQAATIWRGPTFSRTAKLRRRSRFSVEQIQWQAASLPKPHKMFKYMVLVPTRLTIEERRSEEARISAPPH